MAIVFGLMFSVTGLLVLVRGLIEFRTAKESRDWPSVEGVVVYATVDIKIPANRSRRSYAPQVIYMYSVLGQQYISNQISIGTRERFRSQAKAEAKLQYQSGEQITVFYNPDNPAQAVLEPGEVRRVWGTMLIGITFTIGGGIALFYR